MPADIADMDRLLRSDANFVEFMSKKARESDLKDIDVRIQALQRAKETLQESPLRKIHRKEYKNAKTWCSRQNWTEEEVHEMIVEYRRQTPTMKTVTKGGKNLVQGLKNLGQSIAMA